MIVNSKYILELLNFCESDFTYNPTTKNLHYRNNTLKLTSDSYCNIIINYNGNTYSIHNGCRQGIGYNIPSQKISKQCVCVDDTSFLVTFYNIQTLALCGYFYLNIEDRTNTFTLTFGCRYIDTNIPGKEESYFYNYSNRNIITSTILKNQNSIITLEVGAFRIYNNYSYQNIIYGDDIVLIRKFSKMGPLSVQHPASNSKPGLFQEVIIGNEKYRIIAPHVFAVKDDGFYKNQKPW